MLPRLQHLLAETVGTQRRHIVNGQSGRIDLTGNINGGIQRVAAEAALNISAFLRQLNHAFANHGNLFRHSREPDL